MVLPSQLVQPGGRVIPSEYSPPATQEGFQVQEKEDEMTQEGKKSFKFKLTIFMICLINVVISMDSVIVASVLPAITVSLKGDSVAAFWVGTSYLLAQTVSSDFCRSVFITNNIQDCHSSLRDDIRYIVRTCLDP